MDRVLELGTASQMSGASWVLDLWEEDLRKQEGIPEALGEYESLAQQQLGEAGELSAGGF